MTKLHEEFNRFNKEGDILNLDFLTKYAKSLTHVYHADQFIKNLKIRRLADGAFALYTFGRHNIVISYENLISEINEIYHKKRFNIYDDRQVLSLNVELLFSVSHECYHAIQESIIVDPNNKTIISELFTDSYNVCCNDPDAYDKGYDYIPIEINAEILGKLMALKFVNSELSDELSITNNKLVMQDIKRMIIDKDGNLIVPAKEFYKIIDREDRYEQLMKNCNLSDFQRLFLGLPISEEYFERISSICDGTTKTLKLKQYLKK